MVGNAPLPDYTFSDRFFPLFPVISSLDLSILIGDLVCLIVLKVKANLFQDF